MAVTNIPLGDPKAAKRWSGLLFIDTVKKSYFDRKFVSTDDNAVIQQLTDLEQDAGDKISYDLSVQLRQKPTAGDNRLQGKEENLKFFSDEVQIDQLCHGVSAGGKMSRKRTIHNIRKIARARLSDYWSKYIDEMRFIYLEIGVLPQNNMICDCTIFADAVGISFDAGIMTGTSGDTSKQRECGKELFAACAIGTAGGVIKPDKASAYRIASSNVERSIGLKITGGTPAAGAVSITLFIRS